MNRLFWLIVGILLLCTVPAPAQQAADSNQAAEAPKSMKQKTFDFLDQDGNGVLTVDEFVGGSVGRAADEKRATFRKLDADQTGGLEPGEYNNYQPPSPKGDELKQQFERKDADGDGKLTREEFVGQQQGEFYIWGRRNFYRFDIDGDDLLTLEEFGRRGEGADLPADRQFLMCDDDDDGVLSEEEFLRGHVGHPWYDWATKLFPRLDFDHDTKLTPKEFALAPWLKPDPKTQFEALDVDGDWKLSRQELGRLIDPDKATEAWRSFDRYDADGDAALNLSEYRSLANGAQATQKKQASKRSFVTWSRRLLIPTVVLMGLFAVVACYRSWHGRVRAAPSSPSIAAAAPPETSSSTATEKPEDGSIAATDSRQPGTKDVRPIPPELDEAEMPVAESIDEFTIVSESRDPAAKPTDSASNGG